MSLNDNVTARAISARADLNELIGEKTIAIYVAAVNEGVDLERIFPESRKIEISEISNNALRCEKYSAWRLLDIAFKKSLGYDIRNISFNKLDTGRWECDRACFSLSHSHGFVAVAVSHSPIGIDIQKHTIPTSPRFAQRILTADEYKVYSSLPFESAEAYLMSEWTKKEAIFKATGTGAFVPSSINTADYTTHTTLIDKNGSRYYISVCADSVEDIVLFDDVII